MDAAPPPRARLQRRRSYWFLRYGCLSVLVVFFFCCLACSGLFAGTTFAGGPAVFLLATFLAQSGFTLALHASLFVPMGLSMTDQVYSHCAASRLVLQLSAAQHTSLLRVLFTASCHSA